MHWTGSRAAIDAANAAAFATYIARTPTAVEMPTGSVVPNTTTRWAEPQEAEGGLWTIPALDGMDVPEGCLEEENPSWKEE